MNDLQSTLTRIKSKSDYDAVMKSIVHLLGAATKKAGFAKLSKSNATLLAKLSKMAEEYEDKKLRLMPKLRSFQRKSQLELMLSFRINPLKLSALKQIAGKFDLNQNQIAALADISVRTLKQKSKTAKLSVNASEKVLRLEVLFDVGLTAFDSEDSFLAWLKSPIPALGNQIPKELITTHLGIDLVKEELLRVEHSVI